MSTPRTRRSDDVVSEGLALIDSDGWEGLTMVALAQRLGIKGPSLYKHVDSLDALRRRLRLEVVTELGEEARRAVMGLAGDEALQAIADSYRAYARRFPGRYSLTTRMAADGDADYESATTAAMEAGLAVLRSYGLSGDDAVLTIANLWATLHGFVSLEIASAIGRVDRDRAFQVLIENFANGIRQQARAVT